MRTGTRRELLAGLAALSVTGSERVVGSGRADESGATARRTGPAEAFDPAVHGFGFQNWSTRQSTYVEHDHDALGEEQVRRRLGRRWETPSKRTLGVDVLGLPDALFDAIAKQLYVSVNQLSGTSGHCYGMVFAAQQYYENPEWVPLGRETASEFRHPEAPVDDPGIGPVATDVDRYHLTQYLSLHAWLGRRAMLRPAWIDYERQLDRLTAVVDEFGTAGITVFDTASRRSHQVLVYDYRRESDATRLFVYDPNYPARTYARADDPPTVVVDTSGSDATVRPYGKGYDEFVFNRKDRIIAAKSGVDADSYRGPTGGQIRDDAFDLALFLADSEAVSLTVVGPDDRPLGRDTATFVDRSKTEYGRMRYRYGFSPGRYAVRVVGERDAEYALRALVADTEGARLDARRSTGIGAGEVHRYEARVPESGTGSLERVTDGASWPATLGAVGLGAGVAGVTAGAYAKHRGRSRGTGKDAQNE